MVVAACRRGRWTTAESPIYEVVNMVEALSLLELYQGDSDSHASDAFDPSAPHPRRASHCSK